MERSTFIKLSLIGSAGLILPLSYCNTNKPDLFNILSNPVALTHILDKESIIELGILYLKLNSNTYSITYLVELLLKDLQIQTYEDLLIKEGILQKIRRDFETGKTILINGWFISITEAQQCGLLALK